MMSGTCSHFCEIKPIEVHHLCPSRDEILCELLSRVGRRVDLGDGAQLRMRAEDEVDTRASPSQFFAPTVTTLVHTGSGKLPLGAHVEQIGEEVIGQCAR